MFDKRVIENWTELLSQKLGRSPSEILERGLSVYDFSPSKGVFIEFPDKSTCHFNYAFFVVDKEKEMAAVFTEHCGYHEFNICDATIRETE